MIPPIYTVEFASQLWLLCLAVSSFCIIVFSLMMNFPAVLDIVFLVLTGLVCWMGGIEWYEDYKFDKELKELA